MSYNKAEQAVLKAADVAAGANASLKQAIMDLLGAKRAPGTESADACVKGLLEKIRTFDLVVLSAKQLTDSKDPVKGLAAQRYETVRKAYNRMKPKVKTGTNTTPNDVVIVEIPLEPKAASSVVQSAISRLQAIPAEQRRIGTDKLIAAYQALYAVIGEMLAAIPTK